MASYSNREVLEILADRMAYDEAFAEDLHDAVIARNDSWIRKLIRSAIGLMKEVGKALIHAVVGAFFRRY